MSNMARVAIAAAAVLVAGVIGATVLGGGGSGVGSPDATPPPATSPTPAASPVALPAADLEPGATYRVSDPCCTVVPYTFTVPGSGWFAIDPAGIFGKDAIPDPDGYYDVAVSGWIADNVFTDICHWRGNALDPPLGESADALAEALAAQDDTGATTPVDVTLGGLPARKVDLPSPTGLDVATCDDEKLGRWTHRGNPVEGYPHRYGEGQRDIVYVVDTGRGRQIIHAMFLPGTSDADLAELDELIESIRFESTP